jgi:hypothetical protein
VSAAIVQQGTEAPPRFAWGAQFVIDHDSCHELTL